MTRKDACDLVEDLLEALLNYEAHNTPFRRIDYFALKTRVIDALSGTEPTPQPEE